MAFEIRRPFAGVNTSGMVVELVFSVVVFIVYLLFLFGLTRFSARKKAEYEYCHDLRSLFYGNSAKVGMGFLPVIFMGLSLILIETVLAGAGTIERLFSLVALILMGAISYYAITELLAKRTFDDQILVIKKGGKQKRIPLDSLCDYRFSEHWGIHVFKTDRGETIHLPETLTGINNFLIILYQNKHRLGLAQEFCQKAGIDVIPEEVLNRYVTYLHGMS